MSTRYNTGNPIESTDVRDMSDNAKNFDEFSNSTSDSFIDRFGRDRQTIEGSIRKAGFQPVPFDFVTGGTLVSGDRNKAVFNPSPSGDDNWYAWQGAFPKIIPPNSTPSTSGGFGESAWKPVTNNILAQTVRESSRRSYAEAGLNLVGGSFQIGFALANANDVALDEASGKAYSGIAGTYPAGTSTAGFVDRSGVIFGVTTVAYLSTGVYQPGAVVRILDRELAAFIVTAGGTPNGMDILNAGGGNTATLVASPSNTIKAIGALQNNINTDETVFVQRWAQICVGTIEFGNCAVGHINFNVSDVIKIMLTGGVKISPTSELVVWEFASNTNPTTLVSIDLNGHVIDCNHTSQPVRNELMKTNYISTIKVKNGKIKNMKKGGIGGDLSTYDLLEVLDVEFEEGSLHTGTMNESCRFIGVFGGSVTDIRRCKFKQLTDPVGTQVRNPSGVFVSGSNGKKKLNVVDCEFDNLGNLIGGNLESPLDLYSFAESVTYLRNKFTRSRYVPFRATNAANVNIEQNEIVQDVPIFYDGGGVYNDATCLSIGIVDRGYVVNSSDNYRYSVKNNIFKVLGSAGNCRAVTVGSDSTTHVVHSVEFSGNVYSGVNTNTFDAVTVSNVLNTTLDDVSVTGFGIQHRVQQTDLAGAIMASRGLPNVASCNVSTRVLTGTGTGVYARLQVTNLSVTVDGVDMSGLSGLPYSFRNTRVARVQNGRMGSTSNGDTSSNAAFYYLNNDVTVASDPAGYSTNTYYRLLNNIGRVDRVSS